MPKAQEGLTNTFIFLSHYQSCENQGNQSYIYIQEVISHTQRNKLGRTLMVTRNISVPLGMRKASQSPCPVVINTAYWQCVYSSTSLNLCCIYTCSYMYDHTSLKSKAGGLSKTCFSRKDFSCNVPDLEKVILIILTFLNPVLLIFLGETIDSSRLFL